MAVETLKNAKKVLIVDDEKMLAFLLARILKLKGYQTAVAYDAFEAIALIEKGKFDLVIADIRMPEKSGLELIKEINQRYPQDGPKFLILTGFDFELPADQMQQLKISSIIQKPCPRIEELFQQIENAMQSPDLAA
ncbi:MAG: response regulator [Candidatus Omnitrophota bacterium]